MMFEAPITHHTEYVLENINKCGMGNATFHPFIAETRMSENIILDVEGDIINCVCCDYPIIGTFIVTLPSS